MFLSMIASNEKIKNNSHNEIYVLVYKHVNRFIWTAVLDLITTEISSEAVQAGNKDRAFFIGFYKRDSKMIRFDRLNERLTETETYKQTNIWRQT